MVQWVNRTLVQAPRNGTTTHAVSFAAATAGNLLVCVVEGAVTSSTPSGWTLPSGGSAINNTGLYVWWKTATAGESSLTTTHNGSNYPVAFMVYEFPTGSTFVKSVAGTGIAFGAANPNLTALTGTNLLFGAVGVGAAATNSTCSAAWSGTPTPVEDLDVVVVQAATDGYGFSVAYAEDATVTSWQPTGALTTTGTSPNKEALTFAVNVAAGGSTPNTGSTTGGFTVSGSATGARESRGTSAGAVTITGLANGKRAPKGGTVTAFTFDGAAAGVRQPVGTVASAWSVTGAASGKRQPIGAGTSSWAYVGAVFGTAPTTANDGSAVSVWQVATAAVGVRASRGVTTAGWDVGSNVAGARNPVGTVTAQWSILTVATGGSDLRNITVTATLSERAWSSTLTARAKTGTLQPNRWAGTL